MTTILALAATLAVFGLLAQYVRADRFAATQLRRRCADSLRPRRVHGLA